MQQKLGRVEWIDGESFKQCDHSMKQRQSITEISGYRDQIGIIIIKTPYSGMELGEKEQQK